MLVARRILLEQWRPYQSEEDRNEVCIGPEQGIERHGLVFFY